MTIFYIEPILKVTTNIILEVIDMAKIEAGCKLADFSFNTPFESDVKLSEKAKGAKKTVLLFLRYYGCTLCQLDIREYANAYEDVYKRQVMQ